MPLMLWVFLLAAARASVWRLGLEDEGQERLDTHIEEPLQEHHSSPHSVLSLSYTTPTAPLSPPLQEENSFALPNTPSSPGSLLQSQSFQSRINYNDPFNTRQKCVLPHNDQIRKMVESTAGGAREHQPPTHNILISLTTTILKEKLPVILHDSAVESVSVLEQYLQGAPSLPALVLDISDAALLNVNWLHNYNDAGYVHIILFSSMSVVKYFSEGLPKRVWTPNNLLLVNVNTCVDASHLLAEETFNYSPFLSLLQQDILIKAASYNILTYETFRPHKKISLRGTYSFEKPQTFATVFPDRFNSFYGYNIHLASWVNDFPYLVPGLTLEHTYGMGVNMLNEISGKLNFSVTYYKEPEDQLWGEMVNGSWVGMIGQIWRRERDLCVNVMSIVEDRYQAVDFSVPYFTDSYSFVIRNPLQPPRWWSIVLPFSWQTWVTVIAAVAVASILLALVFKVERVPWNKSGVLLQVSGSLLNHGIFPPSSVSSIRIFQGTWLLLAMIISISYTGNLVAYITVPVKPHRLASLRELAESSLTPSMVDYGNFVPGALRSSQHPTLRALGTRLKLVPNYAYDIGFKQVTDGTHAFLEGTEYLQYMVIRYHLVTSTYLLPETLYPVHVGWIYPKKTPWKHKFDFYLQGFVESGMCRYWKQVLVTDFMRMMGQTLHGDSQESVRSLSLSDLQGVFAIYCVCLVVAVTVGLHELLCRRHV